MSYSWLWQLFSLLLLRCSHYSYGKWPRMEVLFESVYLFLQGFFFDFTMNLSITTSHDCQQVFFFNEITFSCHFSFALALEFGYICFIEPYVNLSFWILSPTSIKKVWSMGFMIVISVALRLSFPPTQLYSHILEILLQAGDIEVQNRKCPWPHEDCISWEETF